MIALFRRKPKPPPVDPAELVTAIIDALIVLGCTLTAKGLVTREELAGAYRTAEQQQAAQPGGPARRLAVHTIATFFEAPVGLRLLVDNDRSKTVP